MYVIGKAALRLIFINSDPWPGSKTELLFILYGPTTLHPCSAYIIPGKSVRICVQRWKGLVENKKILVKIVCADRLVVS